VTAARILELFEAYKQGFEQKAPGVRVIVKQQQTN
jgi:hypothetical protein